MILVEDALGVLHVDLVAGAFGPREVEDPIDVGAHDPGLRGERLQLGESGDLLLGAGADLVGKVLLLETLGELSGTRRIVGFPPELAVYFLHLLVEVIIPLVFLDALFHALAYVLSQLEDLVLAFEAHGDFFEAFARIGGLQEFELFLEGKRDVCADSTDELLGALCPTDRLLRLIGNLFLQGCEALEGRLHGLHVRGQFPGLFPVGLTSAEKLLRVSPQRRAR